MYESFYGLKEKPFSLLPDPAYLYLSKQHEMAITLLEYSLKNQAAFCVITGKAGTGKTTLLRRLLNQIGDDVSVGLISNTHHSFGELLRWILHAFKLEDTDKSRALLHQNFIDYLIGQYAKNRRTMLIIDEAQNMSSEALEELRMLSNINSEKDLLLQVILVGQPPLREILRRPDLEQFAQRIAVDYHLDSLSREETHGYIRHRVIVAGCERDLFSDDACDAVFGHSSGIPRLINLLCDLSLVYAYAGQAAVVTEELVEQVVSEREKHGALPVFAKGEPVRQITRAETTHRTSAAKEHHASATHAARKTAGSTTAAEDRVPRAVTGLGNTPQPIPAVPDKVRLAAMKSPIDGNAHKTVVTRGQGAGAVQQPPVESGTKAVTVTPLDGRNSTDKPGGIVMEKTWARSVPSSASPRPLHDDSSVFSKQDTADKQVKTTVLSRKSSTKTDVVKYSNTSPTNNLIAPGWYAALRRGDGAASAARRYIPAVAVIVLLLSAPVAWRHFNQPSERLPETSGSASPAHAVAVTPAAVTAPANVMPTTEPGFQTKPEKISPPALKASAEPVVSEKDPREEARLKRIERERDAALAKARAAEREREVVRAAALERERALAAEHEAALAREQERIRQLSQAAEQARATAAEQAKREAHAEATATAVAQTNKAESRVVPQVVKSGGSVASVAPASDNAPQADAQAVAGEPTLFSANPCKGPSARFLSTCQ